MSVLPQNDFVLCDIVFTDVEQTSGIVLADATKSRLKEETKKVVVKAVGPDVKLDLEPGDQIHAPGASYIRLATGKTLDSGEPEVMTFIGAGLILGITKNKN